MKAPRVVKGLDEKIAKAAENAAGCAVRLAVRTPIIETFRGEVVWEGIVNEHDAENGKRIHAWAVEGAREPQYIAVIQEPPITSALDAVRAWLVSEARKPS